MRWGRPVEGTGGKWTQLFDEDAGRSYFIEEGKTAGQGHWLLPAGVGDPDRVWIEVRDKELGATYYYNPASGARSWVRPEPGVTAERTTAVLRKHARATSSRPSTDGGGSHGAIAPPPRVVSRPQGGSVGERNAAFFQQQKQAKLEAAAEETKREDAKLAAMGPEERDAYLLGEKTKSVHDRRKTSAMKQLMRQSSHSAMGGGNPLKKRNSGRHLGGRGSPRASRGK